MMTKKEAKRLVRIGLSALTDEHVKNLMEAADDGVPIILDEWILSKWKRPGRG